MSTIPLRYNISDWSQLAQCKSNTSTDLYITVKHVIDDGSGRLSGTVIQVEHTQFGVLFACMVNSKGSILNSDPISSKILEMTTEEILKELNKFGFIVTFEINQHLSGAQISYLITLDGLGFDKIRKLAVSSTDRSGHTSISDYLVAFNIEHCPNWITSNYTCKKSEYLDALDSGNAINITNYSQSQQFDWTWLTYVANISDIIRDNGYADALEGEVGANE